MSTPRKQFTPPKRQLPPGIRIPKTSIASAINVLSKPQETTPKIAPITPPKELTQEKVNEVRQKMVNDLTKNSSLKLTYPNRQAEKKQEQEPIDEVNPPILFIPYDANQKSNGNRAAVKHYHINVPNCTHAVHVNSGKQTHDLEKERLTYFDESKYGVDYPILPISRLRYCNVCLPKDHEILRKSKPCGSIKFFTNANTRQNYKHVQFPDYITDELDIYIDKDDVWVNLTHENLAGLTGIELIDKLIVVTKRLNYDTYYALPHPWFNICQTFSEFSAALQLEMLENYFDDMQIIETQDYTESDYDSDSDDTDYAELANKGKQTYQCQQSVQQQPVKETQVSQRVEQTLISTPSIPEEAESMSTVTSEETEDILENGIDTHDSSDESIDDTPDDDELIKNTPRKINLIIPMTSVEDFSKNSDILQFRINAKVHVAQQDTDKISINIDKCMHEDEKKLFEETLKLSNYHIHSNSALLICVNGKLESRQNYVISKMISHVYPSELTYGPVIDDFLENAVYEKLNDEVQSYVYQVQSIYETLKLRKQQHPNDNINHLYLPFAQIKSNQILTKKQVFAYNASSFIKYNNQSNIHASILYDLALAFKYISDIPKSAILLTETGITLCV